MSKDKTNNTKRQNVINEIKRVLPTKVHEDDIPHMYVDTKGHVTMHTGFKVDKPSDLYEMEITDAVGNPLPEDQKHQLIDAEFKRVKDKAHKRFEKVGKYDLEAVAYEPTAEEITQGYGIKMSDTAKDAELDKRANGAYDDIRSRYRKEDFDKLSERVQTGLTSMTYKMGGARVLPKTEEEKKALRDRGKKETGYSNMISAIRRGDYKTAAEESRVPGILDARNKYNHDLFYEAGKTPAEEIPAPRKKPNPPAEADTAPLGEDGEPLSGFQALEDPETGELRVNMKRRAELEKGAEMTAQEKRDMNDLFAIQMTHGLKQFPKEDLDDDLDTGATANGQLLRAFQMLKDGDGAEKLVLMPKKSQQKAKTEEKEAPFRPQNGFESVISLIKGGVDLLTGKAKRPRFDITPQPKEEKPRTSGWETNWEQPPQPKKSPLTKTIEGFTQALSSFNPFAADVPDMDAKTAGGVFDDVFTAKADPFTQDALMNRENPFPPPRHKE
jgi:GH24 family phage-related lysozyme (muramidase)